MKLTSGGFKHGSLCLTVDSNVLRLTACTVKTNAAQQFQLLPSGLLYHAPSRQCLTERHSPSPSSPELVPCSESDPAPRRSLTWEFRVTTPT